MARAPGPKARSRRVLLAEDEEAIAALIHYNLSAEGFEVTVIADGEMALEEAKADPPDVLILDWNLPGQSGLQICKAARKDRGLRQTPILMVTARDGEADILQALEAGADDYVAKPFSVRQLMARVKAVVRRAYPDQLGSGLSVGALTYDPNAVLAYVGARKLKLSPTEFRLLGRLMAKAGTVQSRETLLIHVWGEQSEADARTVDVHIRRLRQQLTKKGEPNPIRTVRSEGYVIDPS